MDCDQKKTSVKKTDYAEAIEILKQDIAILENMEVPISELKAISLIIKAKETAVSAMQELIQYQENGLCLVSTEVYRNMCEELAGYKQIASSELWIRDRNTETMTKIRNFDRKSEPQKELEGNKEVNQ